MGFAAGLGEFLGYGLRLVTGWLSDRTRAYWPLVIGGYAVNFIVIPGLAFVGRWQAAVALVLLERIGKWLSCQCFCCWDASCRAPSLSTMKTNPAIAAQVATLAAELCSMGSEANRKGMARYGINDEWVKRAGFALMAGLAVHDKSAHDRAFLKLLPSIERGASDERNFVKNAVNWALRNIGNRNRALNAAAIACATTIRAAANKRAGGERGGDAAARSGRWVASDALRELTADKTRALQTLTSAWPHRRLNGAFRPAPPVDRWPLEQSRYAAAQRRARRSRRETERRARAHSNKRC